nr:hydroxyproline O-arabinosyltransferase 3-like [Tanacetum cinerariifolium]
MKDDHETDKTFRWVLEMYTYVVVFALHGVQHILWKDFMLQETIPSMVCIKDLEIVDNPKSYDEVVTKMSYRSMLKGLK